MFGEVLAAPVYAYRAAGDSGRENSIRPMPKMGDPIRLEVLRQKLFDKGNEIAIHIVEKHMRICKS